MKTRNIFASTVREGTTVILWNYSRPTLFPIYFTILYLIWCAGWCKVCDGPYSFLLTFKISSWITSLGSIISKWLLKVYSDTTLQINKEPKYYHGNFFTQGLLTQNLLINLHVIIDGIFITVTTCQSGKKIINE